MRTSKEANEAAIWPAGMSIATRRGEVFLKGNPGGKERILKTVRRGWGRETFLGISFRFRKSLPGLFPNWEYRRNRFIAKTGIGPAGVD
jgi:hypothetical protein